MYRVANVHGYDGEKFVSLSDARKAMKKWGYTPLNLSSCDGSREYWADINDLPGEAVTIDELPDPDEWADEYVDDGAYAPQIIEEED